MKNKKNLLRVYQKNKKILILHLVSYIIICSLRNCRDKVLDVVLCLHINIIPDRYEETKYEMKNTDAEKKWLNRKEKFPIGSVGRREGNHNNT